MVSGSATPAALADFQRAARIREGFFRSGGKQPGFKLGDPRSGNAGWHERTHPRHRRRTHEVCCRQCNLPNSDLAKPKGCSANPHQVSAPTAALGFDGPWALFRFFDRFEIQQTSQPEKFTVLLNLEGKRVRLEVIANSVINPFRMREMQQFR